MNLEDYRNRLNGLYIQIQNLGEDSPEFLDLQNAIRQLRDALESLHTESLEDLKHFFKRLEASGRRYQRSGLQVRGADGAVININDSVAELCAENVINPLKQDIYRIVETAMKNPGRKYFGGDMKRYKERGRVFLSLQDGVTPVQKFEEKEAVLIAARLLWIGEFMGQKGRDCSDRGASLQQELQGYDQAPFREFWNAVTYLSRVADPEKKAQVAVLLANRERQLLNKIRSTRLNLLREYRNNHPHAPAEEINDAVDRQLVTEKCFRDMRSYEHLKKFLLKGVRGQQQGALASELSIATERIVNPRKYEDAADPTYSYKTDAIVQRLQQTQEGRDALNNALLEDRKEIRTSGIPEAFVQGREETPVQKCSNLLKEMERLPDKDGKTWQAIARTLYDLKNQDFSDFTSRELENAFRACQRAAQAYIDSHNHPISTKGKNRKALAARIRNEVDAFFTPRIAEARRQLLDRRPNPFYAHDPQPLQNPQNQNHQDQPLQNRIPADLARAGRNQSVVNPNPVLNGGNRMNDQNVVGQANVNQANVVGENRNQQVRNGQTGVVMNHVQGAQGAVGSRVIAPNSNVLDLDSVKLTGEETEEGKKEDKKTNPKIIDLDEKEPENREPDQKNPEKEKKKTGSDEYHKILSNDENEPENQEEEEKKENEKPEDSESGREKMRRDLESLKEEWQQKRQQNQQPTQEQQGEATYFKTKVEEDKEDEKEDKKAGSDNKPKQINLQQLKDDDELSAHVGKISDPEDDLDWSYRDKAGIVEDLLRVRELMQGDGDGRISKLNDRSESVALEDKNMKARFAITDRNDMITATNSLLRKFIRKKDKITLDEIREGLNVIREKRSAMQSGIKEWSKKGWFSSGPDLKEDIQMELRQMDPIAEAVGVHLGLIDGKIRKQELTKLEYEPKTEDAINYRKSVYEAETADKKLKKEVSDFYADYCRVAHSGSEPDENYLNNQLLDSDRDIEDFLKDKDSDGIAALQIWAEMHHTEKILKEPKYLTPKKIAEKEDYLQQLKDLDQKRQQVYKDAIEDIKNRNQKNNEAGKLQTAWENDQEDFRTVRKPGLLTSVEEETAYNIRKNVMEKLKGYCTGVIEAGNAMFKDEPAFIRLTKKAQEITNNINAKIKENEKRSKDNPENKEYMITENFGGDYYTLRSLCRDYLGKASPKETGKREAVGFLKNYLDGLYGNKIQNMLNIPSLSTLEGIDDIVQKINHAEIQEDQQLIDEMNEELIKYARIESYGSAQFLHYYMIKKEIDEFELPVYEFDPKAPLMITLNTGRNPSPLEAKTIEYVRNKAGNNKGEEDRKEKEIKKEKTDIQGILAEGDSKSQAAPQSSPAQQSQSNLSKGNESKPNQQSALHH